MNTIFYYSGWKYATKQQKIFRSTKILRYYNGVLIIISLMMHFYMIPERDICLIKKKT
jgi:uncharacterized protein YecE (DUF72 family)